MTTTQEICRAIQEHRRIVYTYNRAGHAPGEREGNPHIAYYAKTGNLLVDIWKTGGVNTDYRKPPPNWRVYHLDDITVVEIQEQKFSVEPTFRPASNRYHKIVCQV